VSTPVQAAAADLLARGSVVRRQIQARIAANYAELIRQIERPGPCRLLHAEGGWYAVLQVPSFGSEEDLVVELVDRHDVVVHPGYFFDFPRESYLVVSLLPDQASFGEGMARLLRHFDSRTTGHE
jgi:aspartate/methionine/tyrosine aminotransferase